MASYYSTGQITFEDRVDPDFDVNDSVVHLSNRVQVTTVDDPDVAAKPEADGFMKLGDIKGEFSGSNTSGALAGDVDGDSDFDSLQDVRDHNHGNRTNWDVICDVGTSIKQTSVADALTDYRTEGFAEVEIHFVQSVDNDHDPAVEFNQGDPFSELDQGVFAPVNVLRSDNRFVIEPVDLFQGLDAGGMNYAEAVGLDSFTVDIVNQISNTERGY